MANKSTLCTADLNYGVGLMTVSGLCMAKTTRQSCCPWIRWYWVITAGFQSVSSPLSKGIARARKPVTTKKAQNCKSRVERSVEDRVQNTMSAIDGRK